MSAVCYRYGALRQLMNKLVDRSTNPSTVKWPYTNPSTLKGTEGYLEVILELFEGHLKGKTNQKPTTKQPQKPYCFLLNTPI